MRRWTLPTFIALVFAAGAVGGPLRSFVPVFVEAGLHQPPAFSSLLVTLLLVGSGVVAPLGGALADRIGAKWTLICGLGWAPLAGAMYVLGGSVPAVALAAVAGLVAGLETVGGQAYLVTVTSHTRIGLTSALYFLGGTFGAATGSLAAGYIANQWGFGALGAAAAAAGVAVATVAALGLTNSRVDRRSRRASTSIGRSYLALLGNGDFRLIAAMRLLPTCYWGAISLLMPILLYRLSGSVLTVSLYGSVSLALAAGCQLAVGRILDRHGRGWPVTVLTTLVPIAALAAAVGSHELPALFAAGVFGACVAWSVSVTFPPLVRDLIGEGERGRALGLLHLLWVLAMVVGTTTAGLLVEVDAALPLLLATVVNLPIVLVGRSLRRRLTRTADVPQSTA